MDLVDIELLELLYYYILMIVLLVSTVFSEK